MADRTLAMLTGALRELEVGDPRRLSADVGPVITPAAAHTITRHIAAMRARGHRITQAALPPAAAKGSFVPPTLIEIDRIGDVEAEVFGPVLHVLRFRRDGLDALVDAINATGYGLTFGIHSRIEETVARVLDRIEAGNLYVNRNMVGAVVGVQPFGGAKLSGTGPKAGGPLYLRRLLAEAPDEAPREASGAAFGEAQRVPALAAYLAWLRDTGRADIASRVEGGGSHAPLAEVELPGPVGERNLYALRPRGRIAAVAATEAGALLQLGAILATGNCAVVTGVVLPPRFFHTLPREAAAKLERADDLDAMGDIRDVLHEGGRGALMALNRHLAGRDGPIVPVRSLTPAALAGGAGYALSDLVEERALSVNTAAAGGNASLMSIEA